MRRPVATFALCVLSCLLAPIAIAEPQDVPGTIVVNDFSKCTPASAVSRKAEVGAWRLVDLEYADTKGVALIATAGNPVPAITRPLNLKGWYSVHLGLWGDFYQAFCGVRVKLSNDLAFRRVRFQGTRYTEIQDVFWRCADMTGQDLQVAQYQGPLAQTYLAYVRFAPMSPEEVQRHRDLNARATRRLVAMHDGSSFLALRGPLMTKEEFWEDLAPYGDSDFGLILYSCGAGEYTMHPTKYGLMCGGEPAGHAYERRANQSYQALVDAGTSSTATVIRYAHAIRREILVGQRMGGWAMPPPYDAVGPTYAKHPEWRCRLADGTPYAHLSYAFPEVRQLMVNLHLEAVALGADGVYLQYNRGPEFVLYEQPVLDRFRGKYGVDAREMGLGDERLIEVRAGFMTEFMRELRQALDDYSLREGKKRMKIAIALDVPNERRLQWWRERGLDVQTWAREGLVDVVAAALATDPSPGTGLADLLDATRGTRAQVNATMADDAQKLYDAGVAGLCLWDTENIQPWLPTWNHHARLGHPLLMPELEKVESIPIHRVNGIGREGFAGA